MIKKNKRNETYRPNDVGTKNAVSSFISDNFDHTVSIVVRFSTAISSEWKFANFVLDPLNAIRMNRMEYFKHQKNSIWQKKRNK